MWVGFFVVSGFFCVCVCVFFLFVFAAFDYFIMLISKWNAYENIKILLAYINYIYSHLGVGDYLVFKDRRATDLLLIFYTENMPFFPIGKNYNCIA